MASQIDAEMIFRLPCFSQPRPATGIRRACNFAAGLPSPGNRGLGRFLLTGAVLTAFVQPAISQEIPRPSAARQKVKTSVPTVSNFRVGQVLMRVDASVTTDFTDNVNLQRDAKADVIVTPQIGLSATWAATKLNTLRLRTSIGYASYLNSPNLNRSLLVISPDSALNFDIYTGDFRINFHEQFSYQQDPTGEGAVSGVAQLGRFSNTIGTTILWDTNDVIWSLGYDHYNLITTGASNSTTGQNISAFNRLDHSTDQVSASASFRFTSSMIGGVEATGTYSQYPEQSGSDITSYSIGTFLELQLTPYTHLLLSGGYKEYTTGSAAPGTASAFQPIQGTPNGYYASLSLVHRLNRYYSDRLSIGHSDDVDAFNGRSVGDFVRYSASWRINEKLALSGSLSYENIDASSVTTITGTFEDQYSRFGLSLSTGYQLTEHVGMTLGYQYFIKNSNLSLLDYTQNRVSISIGYRF